MLGNSSSVSMALVITCGHIGAGLNHLLNFLILLSGKFNFIVKTIEILLYMFLSH